jgi:hypothetical protein
MSKQGGAVPNNGMQLTALNKRDVGNESSDSPK